MPETNDLRSWSASRRRLLGLMGAAGAASYLPLGLRPAMAQTSALRVRIGADISILDPLRIFQIENQSVAGESEANAVLS